jgi:hypothetical protein
MCRGFPYETSTVGLDTTINFAYLASAVFVVGVILGLIGFFGRSYSRR